VDDYLRMVRACAEKDRDEVILRSTRLGFLTGARRPEGGCGCGRGRRRARRHSIPASPFLAGLYRSRRQGCGVEAACGVAHCSENS